MEDGYQITAQKLFGLQGAPDTSQQMFGLVDDVAGNFRAEFESAKSRQDAQAKSAKGKKSEEEEPAAEGASAEESAEQGAASADEGAGEEVQVDIPKEEIAEGEVEAVAEEAMELPEEAVAEADEEIVVDAEEEVVEVSEEPEAAVEEVEVADAGTVDEEAEVSEEIVEAPVEEVEAVVEEETPVAEAVSAEEAKPQEEVAAAPVKAEQPVEEAAPLDEAPEEVVAEKREAPKVAPAKKEAPKVAPKIAEAQQAEEAPAKKEATPVPENFHSIVAEGDEEAAKVIQLDSKEARRILEGLQSIAAKSQIQNPAASKVSPQLLEGLKANNAQLAKQIEAARAPAAPQPGQAFAAPKGAEAKAFQAPAKSDKPYPNPRMEELKQKVMEQVKFQMKMAMRNKAGEIHLKLKPHMLGNVKVNLIVEQAQVTAAFVVENQSVRDLLQRSSGQLHDMLKEQGLEVDQIEVAVDQENSDGSSSGKAFASVEDQKAAREYLASFAGLGGRSEEEADNSSQEEAADSDQILNIVA